MSNILLKNILLTLFILLIAIPISSFNDKHLESISIRMEKRSLHKGRATVTIADIYFKPENGSFIKNYIKPTGNVSITNPTGELIIFNKECGTAYSEKAPDYNTEDNVFFFILSEMVSSKDLKGLGFKVQNTSTKDDKTIIRWLPPKFMKHLFSYTEIIYKDDLPFCASYYDENENIIVKTYFTDYESYPEITIPLTITEFFYVNESDSIINRIKFNDIRVNDKSKNDYFDFSIPDDAM